MSEGEKNKTMISKLTVPQRIQIGLVLAMTFLLVLGATRLDQKNFTSIQATVNSVYKDRVVVQNYIHQLTNIFHEKQLHIILKDKFILNASQNKKVIQLLSDFGVTKLTQKESELLNKLNNQFTSLENLENEISESSNPVSANDDTAVVKKLDSILISLNGLASIQLEESGLETQLSNKSLSMNILLSKLEVAFLVIIGIAMLVLIFNPMKLMLAYPSDISQN